MYWCILTFEGQYCGVSIPLVQVKGVEVQHKEDDRGSDVSLKKDCSGLDWKLINLGVLVFVCHRFHPVSC